MSETVTIEEGRGRWIFCRRRTRRTIKSIAFMLCVQPIASRRWKPVRQGVFCLSAPSAPGVAVGLEPRHDYFSNYMSGDFQPEINVWYQLSPSFVREPEGNGVAGALHPNLENRPCSGCACLKPSRNCAPSSGPFAKALTTALGSSRGMESKRLRGSEEEGNDATNGHLPDARRHLTLAASTSAAGPSKPCPTPHRVKEYRLRAQDALENRRQRRAQESAAWDRRSSLALGWR